MLTVWGRATSSNVQKVMWTVGELGLEHERLDVGGHFGGLDTPEYRAMNPNMRVPTVVFDDGVVMWESNAVVRYMARHDPQRRLWPAGGQPEASAEMWQEWAQIAVGNPVTGLFWAVVRTAPSKRDPKVIAGHLSNALEGLALAENQLARHPFLAGDSLSIADIVFGTALYRYHEMAIERPVLPNVAAYYQRLVARPAYAEHAMVDFSSLAVHD